MKNIQTSKMPSITLCLKINRLILFALIFSSICLGISYGQGDPSKVNFLSPQTYEFVKYGNIPASHFTGETNVTIPIYTYKDQDFELPIYLGYNSSGFIPGKREGVVGLNWFINTGAGVITRSVNGWPDERTGKPTTIPTELHGLYYGIKNNLQVKNKTKSQLSDPQNGTVSAAGFWHIDGCEVDPDDFTFNMPGNGGRFFIENNGEIRTSGNRPFKVGLSGFSIQPPQGTTVNNSAIIITTDDGFKYHFGGTKQYLEISYPLIENDNVGLPVIVGWHLSKIEAPNGRVATYEYEAFNNDYLPDYPDPYHYLLNVFDVEYASGGATCNDFAGGTCSYVGSSPAIQTVKGVTKTVYLKKITIENTTIDFIYGEKANKFYTDESIPLNQKNYQLNSVLVKTQDVIVKEFNFGYEYRGGTYSRLFLTSFQEVGKNPYQFDYYNTGNLPNPKTRGVDYWGFWNGGSVKGPLIPAINYYQNGDIVYTSSVRASNNSLYNVALLKKVEYPTWGFTEFIYEPHSYSKRLERRNSGNFVPQLFTVSGNTGGARISKIKDHDGERYINEREFKYVKDYVGGGAQSSGILLSWPRYLFYWKYDDGYTVQHKLQKKSTSYNVNYYPGENFIQYGEVTEIHKPSNGFTNYKFTNYETHPDFNDYLTSVVIPHTQQYITNVHLYNSFVGIKLNDRSFERGKPSEVTSYATNPAGGFFKVKKTTAVYSSKDNNPDNYVVGVHATGGIAQSFKLYYYPVLTNSTQEIIYDDAGENPVTVQHQYQYTIQGYISKKTITKSNGEMLASTTTYPHDYASGTTFIDNMKSGNLLSYPIEQVQYKEAGDTRILSGQITKYKTGGKGQIDEILQLETENPILLSGFKFSNRSIGVLPTIGNPTAFLPDSRYKQRIKYNNYDSRGNLLQYTPTGDVSTSYQWDYWGRYPVSQVKNAISSEIAYTSFEADSKGNWSYSGSATADQTAPTGRMAYLLSSGNLSKGGLNSAKTYTVSYWRKGGSSGSVSVSGTQAVRTGRIFNGWTYEEKDVLGISTATLSGSVQIDEVRLYPKDAQMFTYTYDPLIGMTSQTNPAGITTYYEYSLGRLKIIKDHEGNINQQYEYHFKNQ